MRLPYGPSFYSCSLFYLPFPGTSFLFNCLRATCKNFFGQDIFRVIWFFDMKKKKLEKHKDILDETSLRKSKHFWHSNGIVHNWIILILYKVQMYRTNDKFAKSKIKVIYKPQWNSPFCNGRGFCVILGVSYIRQICTESA